ncbi:hypothetical protein EYF80_060104 [Liparis tanakae]|uniref:Uncharacterized protein n=1 Tax=Liparis tanakae TaxID=230148 RepID=A0A4Z2ELH6_9TELE|nr:hypothetical protein EYF80_060104 [Liparis tanakae]
MSSFTGGAAPGSGSTFTHRRRGEGLMKRLQLLKGHEHDWRRWEAVWRHREEETGSSRTTRQQNVDLHRGQSLTWSMSCRSGKKGMFLAHSTALNSSRAASSQMFSMPIRLFPCMHCAP